MSNNVEHEINCYCEAKIPVIVPEIYDLDADPGVIDKIKAGDFLKTTCPNCGKELKPELDLRFFSDKTILHFLPEIERESFYKGETDCSDCTDLVIGFAELREYFIGKTFNLQRFPLEAIKLHLLQKAPSNLKVEIYFEDFNKGNLTFNILGLKDDQVGVVTVPLTTYQTIEKDQSGLKDQEPYSAMMRGPYLSVKLVSFEEAS